MDSDGHFQVINAEVPLAHLHDYATALKSMSSGRGMFVQEFSHYEDMPHNEAEKVKSDYHFLLFTDGGPETFHFLLTFYFL